MLSTKSHSFKAPRVTQLHCRRHRSLQRHHRKSLKVDTQSNHITHLKISPANQITPSNNAKISFVATTDHDSHSSEELGKRSNISTHSPIISEVRRQPQLLPEISSSSNQTHSNGDYGEEFNWEKGPKKPKKQKIFRTGYYLCTPLCTILSLLAGCLLATVIAVVLIVILIKNKSPTTTTSMTAITSTLTMSTSTSASHTTSPTSSTTSLTLSSTSSTSSTTCSTSSTTSLTLSSTSSTSSTTSSTSSTTSSTSFTTSLTPSSTSSTSSSSSSTSFTTSPTSSSTSLTSSSTSLTSSTTSSSSSTTSSSSSTTSSTSSSTSPTSSTTSPTPFSTSSTSSSTSSTSSTTSPTSSSTSSTSSTTSSSSSTTSSTSSSSSSTSSTTSSSSSTTSSTSSSSSSTSSTTSPTSSTTSSTSSTISSTSSSSSSTASTTLPTSSSTSSSSSTTSSTSSSTSPTSSSISPTSFSTSPTSSSTSSTSSTTSSSSSTTSSTSSTISSTSSSSSSTSSTTSSTSSTTSSTSSTTSPTSCSTSSTSSTTLSTSSTTSPTSCSTSSTSSTTSSTSSTSTTTSMVCNFSCLNQTWISSLGLLAKWTFDGTFFDQMNTYNITAINNPSFSTSGYVNQALLLNAASNQYLYTSYIPLINASFTVELWLYPTGFPNPIDHSILGLCTYPSNDQCLHLTIRNFTSTYRLYMSFFGDSCVSNGSIPLNQWTHAAFVFDSVTLAMAIYLNGQAVGGVVSVQSLQGTANIVTIGYIPGIVAAYGSNFFQGYFDQLTIVSRAKPTCEILDDATLATYYTFDNGPILNDSGPNSILSTSQSVSFTSSGHSSTAISFNNSTAYLLIGALTGLGTVNKSFSISLWIRPCALAGTLVFVSQNAAGSGWCIPFMGFATNGSIVAQMWQSGIRNVFGPAVSTSSVWYYIVQTWSSTNGLRLYIDNVLVASNPSAVSYTASSVPDYVKLANRLNNSCAPGSVTSQTAFYGDIDSFRIYSRELTADDVCALYQW